MSIFRMPSLGADMEDGILIEWLKQPGDRIARGDIVAVVETQKGAIEIEIFDTGILKNHLAEPGAKLPVGAPLAEIDDGRTESVGQAAPAVAAPAPLSVSLPLTEAVAPPRVATPGSGLKASPAARKLAADTGIDLAAVAGTGLEGAVTFVDVENVLKARPAETHKAPATKRASGLNLAAMRKAIAAAMSRAKREIPHYYLSHAVDLGPAMTWLGKTNASRPPAERLLLGAIYAKAVARALRDLPEFNGFYREGDFQTSADVHLGIAIAIRGGGLIAPAVHNAGTLSLDETMRKMRDLTTRARSGHLRSSELSNATITLSSLGDRGADALYGIIYPPQVALLGFGTPRQTPWPQGDAVVIRPTTTVTLAADHRVSDGHRGALFLAKIAEHICAPESL